MRKPILLLISLIFAGVSLKAGELKISPEQPERFSEITINYTPDGRYPDQQYRAFIYSFEPDKNMPDAFSIELRPVTEELATGKFTLPDKAVFLLIKIDGNDTYYNVEDDNKGSFWDIMVHEEGWPVKSAYLKKGLSYMGNYPEYFNRMTNLNKAISNLESEIELYPENLTAKIGLASLLFDTKRLSREAFESRLNELLEGEYNPDSENEVRAVSRALKTLNFNDRAQEIEKKFIENNPNSELAEEQLMTEISQASSIKDFAVKCKEFFDRFPRSDKRPEVFSAFASAFFQINNATILLNELEKIDDVPDAIYARIAYEIATDKDLLQDLRPSERIDTALSIFSEIWGGKLPPDSLLMADKPQYYTSHEWRKNKMAVYGSIAETGGDLYLIDGDNLKAMNMYESALRLQQYNTPESLYEKLLTTADELDRDSLALDYSARAITNSKMTDNIVKAFELHFKKLNAVDDSLYNQALDSLLAKAQDRRLTELKYKMLDYKPEAGVLKTLDGRIIDLIDLRGKITIMNFWASWCGPCQAMMPAVDSLYSEYDEDPDVEVVAVNIWEQSADREQAIKNFLKDVESRFPVAYDDLDVLPRRFGITGLPVTVFLDEEGYLRFKYEGYSNIDDFMIACFDRVNLLKKMVQKNEAGR